MRIGILGLLTESENKGCLALTYSFFCILESLAEKHNMTLDVVVFNDIPVKRMYKMFERTDYSKKDFSQFVKLKLSNINYVVVKKKVFFQRKPEICDLVFDFTQGDSFTDLYGEWRYYHLTYVKKAIISKNIPLVLGNQTIGPFKNPNIERDASEVLRQAKAVYARDLLSYNYAQKLVDREIKLTTDVAFFLPYNKHKLKSNAEIIRIGINVSGLLWNNGYTGNNEFRLTVDYKRYIRNLLTTLLKDNRYEVHIIMHVFSENENNVDNDHIPALCLKEEFPKLILAPAYESPIEIKNYIAAMDFFIGARMHSTIAALSAGVPVLPFSYSRKFEGLFDSLTYKYIVEGTRETTERALDYSLECIEKRELLQQKICESMKIVEKEKEELFSEYEKLIYGDT